MIYAHREGPIAAGDTRTALTTQGAIVAPGTIIVPPGCSRITQVICGVGDNTPAAADGGMNFFVTLAGTAMVDGEQSILVGATFQDFTTAGDTGTRGMIFELHNVDINVVAGGIVNIYAEGTLGVLTGLPEFGVSIGFA